MGGVSLGAETIFTILGFPVTNAFFVQAILSLVLIFLLVRAAHKLSNKPSKAQVALELAFNFLVTSIDNISGDRAKTKKILPFVATLFFYILICNFFSMVPGLSAFTINHGGNNIGIFRTATSDYSLVFVMSFVTILIVQIVFIAWQGLGNYIKQFIDISSPINFMLGIINIFGEIAKILSLSFRLFGNMFAGEVLTAVMLFLVPFIAPIPFTFLSILTCAIQAFVFSILSAVYLIQAMQIPEAPTKQNAHTSPNLNLNEIEVLKN